MAVFRFLKGLFGLQIKRPGLNQISAAVSILGFGVLCFILGSAVMYFRLPPWVSLQEAFLAAQALQKQAPNDALYRPTPLAVGVTVDMPDKTEDGFTLYATSLGSWAALIDMKGNLVHEWRLPYKEARAHMGEVAYPPSQKHLHWFGCRLFSNGELLAVYQVDGEIPSGYGLIKLDRNSKLLWSYAGRVHHDLDVGEDGNIYALEQKLAGEVPSEMAYLGTPYVADYLVALSPEGKDLYPPIPLLESFRDSKYSSTLQLQVTNVRMAALPPTADAAQTKGAKPIDSKTAPSDQLSLGLFSPRKANYDRSMISKGDYIHPNAARFLGPSLAPKFPLFKAGQVLISFRNIDSLAVLDVPSRSMVWMAQGVWRRQHAPEFLANGHLLLYDNLGGLQTRVLEYDPVSQTIPWAYSNENSAAFSVAYRGTTQRLANGNTLIVNSDICRIFEVTQSKEVVWEAFCREPAGKEKSAPGSKLAANITSARRYRADQLKFLKAAARP